MGLRSTPNPSSHGQPVTFTATVSAPGLGLPTGEVTFLDDGTSIGTVPVTNGTARLTTDMLAAGSHPIVAYFVGSGGSGGFDRRLFGACPGRDDRRDDDGRDLRRGPVGRRRDGDVRGDGRDRGPQTGTPGGTVTFLDGLVCSAAGRSTAGIATFATSTLAAGVHYITARYDGDASFTGSTSSVIQQHVGTPTANDDDATVAEDADPTRSPCWAMTPIPTASPRSRILRVSDPDHGLHRSMTAGRPATSPTTPSSISPTATSMGSTCSQEHDRRRHAGGVCDCGRPGHAGQRSSDRRRSDRLARGPCGDDADDHPDGDRRRQPQPHLHDRRRAERRQSWPTRRAVVHARRRRRQRRRDRRDTAGSLSDSLTFQRLRTTIDPNVATVDVPVGAVNPAPDPHPGSYPSPAGSEGAPIALHGSVANTPPSDVLTKTWSYTLGAGRRSPA